MTGERYNILQVAEHSFVFKERFKKTCQFLFLFNLYFENQGFAVQKSLKIFKYGNTKVQQNSLKSGWLES